MEILGNEFSRKLIACRKYTRILLFAFHFYYYVSYSQDKIHIDNEDLLER